MIEFPQIEAGFTLGDYQAVPHLAATVGELRTEAAALAPQLSGRTLWMVNSTARGGGVAEMLPQMVALLNELGVRCRWAVIGAADPRFFHLTKRLHNLIHGKGEPSLAAEDREVYESVSRENARELDAHVDDQDLLVIHDPQPFATGAFLARDRGVRSVWRCHIGLDEHTPATRAAWKFLRPYADAYRHAVFSAPEYIPDYLAGHASVIHPGIDPESHKNRELHPHKLVGIMCNSGLKNEDHPVLTPAFQNKVQRLRPDGTFGAAADSGGIGLLYRPIVSQVSRWDRLKGFGPLMRAFVRIKTDGAKRAQDPRHQHRLDIVRLVLAGPDPASIQDDPEGQEVFQELVENYRRLPPALQPDVALLTLPMDSRKENALMVNVLQRCSSVVVQNSVREGFGLTATEGMWKRVAVIGTHACGLRQQIRHGIDGVLVMDPENTVEVAAAVEGLLMDPFRRDRLGRSAQRRVHAEFLIFTQLRRWLRLLAECATTPARLDPLPPPGS